MIVNLRPLCNEECDCVRKQGLYMLTCQWDHVIFHELIFPSLMFASCCVLSYVVFLKHKSTQQFYNKQVNTTVLIFFYCVELLLHVSSL
jgi:hypothetical protein